MRDPESWEADFWAVQEELLRHGRVGDRAVYRQRESGLICWVCQLDFPARDQHAASPRMQALPEDSGLMGSEKIYDKTVSGVSSSCHGLGRVLLQEKKWIWENRTPTHCVYTYV